MTDNDHLPSLEKLQEKIDVIKNAEQNDPASSSTADMSQAMRLVIDLSAGVMMGVGVGYFLDRWLTTLPLFMIIGVFLGVAAGVKNMMRSADLIDKKLNEQQKNDKKI